MKNKLLKSELIILLKNKTESESIILEKAYDNFITKLHTFIQDTIDLTTSFFVLNHTRVELLDLKRYLQSTEKKTVL